ncbi:MAG TPA: GntR family transcriptional regulator [Ornithinimicrobium sp.]|uniref:GntR family transcriptional regulator n=1 Tax=Ornithinimicrobium sp. TaxID=1977084 RepID=UPI002B483B90|nr:GntR family transcriptional regulator [Ornithinimicrobium sp.]HKJ11036.1 GntR family transcriptional regulator [Ornithinimicrobium sp.]
MSATSAVPPSHLRRVVQQSTPMIIAAQVREAIAQGHFPPGAQMYETQLAEQLGVSRGPLREGLQRLTQEGLLVAVRHRGLFVVELTPENVRDMYLAREAIERCAVAVVVRDSPMATADALDVVLAQMEAAAEVGDSQEVGESDIRFHEVLVARSGSERLGRLHGTQLVEARICVHALGSSYENDRHRVAEHRAIAEAIRSADAALADQRLRQHMVDAVQELMVHAPGGAESTPRSG